MSKRIISFVLCLTFLSTLLPLGITSFAENEEIIRDGLVAWYDGKNNTEKGHDPNSEIWYDLAGDNDITVAKTSTNYFTEDAYHLKSAQYYFPDEVLDVVNGNEFTVELSLGTLKKMGSSFATLINNYPNDNFSLFLRVSGDYIEFKAGTNSRPKIVGGLNYFNNSTVTVTFKVGGAICMYVDGILIGQTAATSKIGADGKFYFGHADAAKAHEADYKSIRFYNRALTKNEVINNAKADGTFDENYVAPPEFADIAQPETNIIGDICLSTYVTTKAELDAVVASKSKPANVIFYADKDLKITDASYKNAYSTVADVIKALDGKMIPTFYVNTNESAKAVVDYLEAQKISDAYIMSDIPEVVRHARTEYTSIRGIIDFTSKYKDKKVTNADLIEIRKITTKNLSKVAVIPDTIATLDNVKYLNSRQITTWVGATSKIDTDKEAVELLISGAYGIVSQDTEFVLTTADKYIVEKSLTRTPMIIGHRGIPGMMPENILEGAIEAYKQGADVIEVDIYLTLDGVLAVNHDSSTTKYNKKLSVESSTWSQLSQLYYTHNGKQYKMPKLEDYFKEFKGKDCMIFIEIKSSKAALISAMKKLIDEYDFYDQCAVIAFEGTTQLTRLKQLYPEMPVGFLVSAAYSGSTMLPSIQQTIGKYNTTYNPSYSGYGSDYVRKSIMRGITTWPWTINGSSDVHKYIMYGHAGVTTDNSNHAGKLVEKLEVSYAASEGKSAFQIGETVELNTNKTTYNHTTEAASATKYVVIEGQDICEIKDNKLTFKNSGNVTVMAMLTDTLGTYKYTVYAQPVSFTVAGDNTTAEPDGTATPDGATTPDGTTAPDTGDTTAEPTTENKPADNTTTIIIIVVVAVVVIAGAAVAVILIKKSKNKA